MHWKKHGVEVTAQVADLSYWLQMLSDDSSPFGWWKRFLFVVRMLGPRKLEGGSQRTNAE